MSYANTEFSRSVDYSAFKYMDFDDMALGDESRIVAQKYDITHFFTPYSTQLHEPRIKFITLKNKWEQETIFLSSAAEICMHTSYQQIIGMGPVAIPLILSEMKKKPGHWFWALQAITGEDPVLPAERGRIKKMTAAWLRWGKMEGYL